MEGRIKDFCIECGNISEFFYDGEQWVCLTCGSHDSMGDQVDSIPSPDEPATEGI